MEEIRKFQSLEVIEICIKINKFTNTPFYINIKLTYQNIIINLTYNTKINEIILSSTVTDKKLPLFEVGII